MANKQPASAQPNSKKLFIVFGLCSLLALAVCLGVVVAVTLLQTTEGTYDMPETNPLILSSYYPDTDLIDENLEAAKDCAKVHITHTNDFSISRTDGADDAESRLIDRWLSGVRDTVKEAMPSYEAGEFGVPSDIPAGKIDRADIKDMKSAIGETDEATGETKNGDCYFYDITLNDGCDAYPDCAQDENVKRAISEKIAGVFDHTVSYKVNSVKIKARADGLTRQLDYLRFERNVTVTLTMGENGDLGGFAAGRTYVFDYTVTDNYDFSFAGISFAEKEVTLAHNEEKALSVNAVLNDYAEYTVAFESSDPDRVSVDEQGYAKGRVLSAEPVKIKVTLTYLGNTYEDTCLVYVTKPVEEISVSDKELTLKKGETATISASLKPADATIGTVIWIAEGDAVKVENGKITAVKEGTADVIAVSEDGNFRATCKVTVEGGTD